MIERWSHGTLEEAFFYHAFCEDYQVMCNPGSCSGDSEVYGIFSHWRKMGGGQWIRQERPERDRTMGGIYFGEDFFGEPCDDDNRYTNERESIKKTYCLVGLMPDAKQ
ncbi:hypothetical protein BDZ89DRAFT_1052153 [Hymenopellis radicata]|nr:hypothetical protein BDZ89DRAFT_1052153 [Hymenopellis radicata]